MVTGGTSLTTPTNNGVSATGNGYDIGGAFTFTANGGDAKVTFTSDELLASSGIFEGTYFGTPVGYYRVLSGVSGSFSVDEGTNTAHEVDLTQYTNDVSVLAGSSTGPLYNENAEAIAGAPFAGSVQLPTGNVSDVVFSEIPFYYGGGTIDLHASSVISFSGLEAGDVVTLDLPNNNDMDPAVLEPASLTLLGIGIVGMAGYGWRRKRSLR